MDKKSVLVTGGAGYIGSHTVVELFSAGFEPIIVDDFRNSDIRVIKRLQDLVGQNIPYYSIDVCDYSKFKSIAEEHKIEGIIHFAAYKAVGESVQDPLKYYANNVQGVVNVLQLMLNYDIKHLIFSSSCTVYGIPSNGTQVVENDDTTKANSPYGTTKVIGEQILVDVAKSNPSLRILSLRYFNPIGAHPSAQIGELPIGKPNNLVPFITQTAAGKYPSLTVHGDDYPTSDGTCVRDYIHVVDLAKAHVMGLEHLVGKQEETLDFINVGTGQGLSVLEMIRTFVEVSGVQLNYAIGPRRPGDVAEIYANAEKVDSVLGWKPIYSAADAVLHAWNWEKVYMNEK